MDQAVVAADAVAALPPQVAEHRPEAVAVLRGHAGVFDPARLARIGRGLVAVLDPEQGDRLLAAQLEREERDAVDRRCLVLDSPVAGLVRGRFALATADAAVLAAALGPFTRPAPAGADGVGDERTGGQRRADALVQVCRRSLGAADGPTTGGERAQLVVTVGWAQLRDAVGAGELPDGEPLAPSVVRRWACDAGVLPAVLGGAGQPLDIGRETRTVPVGLRRALVLRERGCVFPHCDRPPGWCEAHHIRHWAEGGPTALGNLTHRKETRCPRRVTSRGERACAMTGRAHDAE